MSGPNPTHPARASAGALLAAAGAMALLAAPMTGCRGDRSDKPPRQFFPGMDDNPRWDPQETTPFFADGRVMRPSVEGTVAFGRSSVVTDQDWAEAYRLERAMLLKEDTRIFRAMDADGSTVRDIPVPVDQALLDLGAKKFQVYCAACHGYNGDGKGMVGQMWSYPLPNLHDDKYFDKNEPTGTDGHLWNIARYGKYDEQGVQRMPGYEHALDEVEAWGVVAYIRALQASRRGTLDEVPASQRELLRRQQSPTAAPAGQGDAS